ncbi:MAG: hypothetical protein A2W80_14350 [Candidatus Riflebacteria bacterium GWC2_50_8]|nr:MAG: hypothetical protein A2W80_14350 [Candidatus Riflebacteria bacterium GWC2_50_8]
MNRKTLFLVLAILLTVSASYADSGENLVRSLVYKWFSLFDRNAPAAEFLQHLPGSGFKMVFPEQPINNHAEFNAWYKGVLATVKTANHTIKKLDIAKVGEIYHVELVVLWRATTHDGKELAFDAFQTWKVAINSSNHPVITEYLVSDGKGFNNPTIYKLRVKKEPVFGGFVTIGNHKVIENLTLAGKLDFVWLEAEHTEFDPETVQNLTITAENEKVSPVVRVPANDFNLIKKYIGTGVQGIIVPSIKTADDARSAINAIKYSPQGNRACGAERGNRYLGRFAEYTNSANDEILAILMLETREAVDNIEEILQVPGIDVLHVGPYDLSLSYGVDMKSEKLALAIKRVELAAQKHGVLLGCAAPTMAVAREKIQKGYKFFTIPGDMEMLQNGVKSYFSE